MATYSSVLASTSSRRHSAVAAVHCPHQRTSDHSWKMASKNLFLGLKNMKIVKSPNFRFFRFCFIFCPLDYGSFHLISYSNHGLLPRDAMQSAVMRLYVVCPSVRPSICLSVTLRYVFHPVWNTSKTLSRLISLKAFGPAEAARQPSQKH